MKFRVCMIILILAGILTGGIGAGAAIAEFSELEYEGTVWLGGEEETETTLVYEMEGQDADRIYCYAGMDMQEQPVVVENRKVPLDEIWFEITYNPARGEPVIGHTGRYQDAAEIREEIHIWTNSKSENGLKEIMDAKDRILEDLKDKKISAYQYAPVTRMKIQVHPENVEKLMVMG